MDRSLQRMIRLQAVCHRHIFGWMTQTGRVWRLIRPAIRVPVLALVLWYRRTGCTYSLYIFCISSIPKPKTSNPNSNHLAQIHFGMISQYIQILFVSKYESSRLHMVSFPGLDCPNYYKFPFIVSFPF